MKKLNVIIAAVFIVFLTCPVLHAQIVTHSNGEIEIPIVNSTAGPFGTGSLLWFSSSADPSTVIQEYWGLNLSGTTTKPVKVPFSSLLVGYTSVGASTSYGTGNAFINGNVGIGTTNPVAKLGLVGGGMNLQTNAGQYTLSAVDNAASTPMTTGYNVLGLNSGDLMLRSYWGVSVDLNDGLNSDGTGNNTYSRIPMTSSFTVNSRSSSTGFNTLFTVKNNGNVLIGQTLQKNSSYILDVNGTARANGVVVNSSGADYVFNYGYHLLPLSEVKIFIDKNHHLPEIPSAKEMKENGLNVGDNQTKLLQKVEELTLYLIEKDKQLTIQQSLIAENTQNNQQLLKLLKSQQKQINELKKRYRQSSKK